MAQIFDLSKEVKKRKTDKVKPIYFNFDNKKYLIKNDFESLNLSSKALKVSVNEFSSIEDLSPDVIFSMISDIPEVLEKIVGKEFVDKIVKLDVEQVFSIYLVILFAVQIGSVEEAYKIIFPEEEKEPEDE